MLQLKCRSEEIIENLDGGIHIKIKDSSGTWSKLKDISPSLLNIPKNKNYCAIHIIPQKIFTISGSNAALLHQEIGTKADFRSMILS